MKFKRLVLLPCLNLESRESYSYFSLISNESRTVSFSKIILERTDVTDLIYDYIFLHKILMKKLTYHILLLKNSRMFLVYENMYFILTLQFSMNYKQNFICI